MYQTHMKSLACKVAVGDSGNVVRLVSGPIMSLVELRNVDVSPWESL
jgi:hypothetical protein